MSTKKIQSRSWIKLVIFLFLRIRSSTIVLELFLSDKEVSEIHDFEEEQIDEYFAMKDREKKNTTADQISLTSERYDSTFFFNIK